MSRQACLFARKTLQTTRLYTQISIFASIFLTLFELLLAKLFRQQQGPEPTMIKKFFLFFIFFLSQTSLIKANEIAILATSSQPQAQQIISALNSQSTKFETALTSDTQTNDPLFYQLLKQYFIATQNLNHHLITDTYLPHYPEDKFTLNYPGFKIYQDEGTAFIGIDWQYLQQTFGQSLSAPTNFWLDYKIQTAETRIHDPETAKEINKIYLSYREKAYQADKDHTDFLEKTYWQKF